MELSLEIAVPITKSLFLEPLSETITMSKLRISQIQKSKSNVLADPMLATPVEEVKTSFHRFPPPAQRCHPPPPPPSLLYLSLRTEFHVLQARN